MHAWIWGGGSGVVRNPPSPLENEKLLNIHSKTIITMPWNPNPAPGFGISLYWK